MPPPNHRFPTIKQIAARSGVSVATVSYALRNSPKVHADTRQLVQSLAREMGYRPNPQVAALMTHIRQARGVSESVPLAFVWVHATRAESAANTFAQETLAGARERAVRFGYVRDERDGVFRIAATPRPKAPGAALSPGLSDRPGEAKSGARSRDPPPATSSTAQPNQLQTSQPQHNESPPVKNRNFLSLLTAVFLTPGAVEAQPTEASGSLTGSVSNVATRNMLEGARITVPRLNLTAFTDNTGRYFIARLPVGSHEVVASYAGLDSQRVGITIAAGTRAVRDFDLTSETYKLDAFRVIGEREGNALAITMQRNAANVKNVVAMDAYGNLSNMNASELAVLLPGVAGTPGDEGNYGSMSIRGTGSGMNTVTIDGAIMGTQSGDLRAPSLVTITGSIFEQLELIKGHTPDKDANSLGGSINLKSRSPLSIREKRRTTYNVTARWAPPFIEQIPLREQHRTHPILNVAHQEVFDVLNGQRNLGVALNLFYSENVIGSINTRRNFQNTTSEPAYLWDFFMQDNFNNRKQSSVSAKVDFRLSPHTKISFNGIYNDAMERLRHRHSFQAFTGNANVVPNATNSGVVPGFTSQVTQVRPVAGSTIDIISRTDTFYNRQRHYSIEVEQEFGPLQLDYAAVVSWANIHGTGGSGGTLTNRVTGVGWILDRTSSDLFPQFTQTAGPDITKPASYRPETLTFLDQTNPHDPREVRFNAAYKLPTVMPLTLKTGGKRRGETGGTTSKNRRFLFTGVNSAQLPTDPTIQTLWTNKLGLAVPRWNADAVSRERTPLDLSIWREDPYYAEMSKFTPWRGASEHVTAGYIMTQGRVGSTGFLAGVRTERTEDDSWAWVRSRVLSTPAQQQADPIGSARRDYGNLRKLHGSYTQSFPSVHLTQDFRANLKGRLSWSNGFARPTLLNLMPSETPNESQMTLTVNNPNLRPQQAENWDATLEYYFNQVGHISAGWFHKTIRDYFVNGVETGTVAAGPDNGYNGEYAGFQIRTSANLGTAIVQGWELSLHQQFTFLPGPLKGLSLNGNFTILDTHGDFGGLAQRRSGEVAGFIPRSGSAQLGWNHRGLSVRVRAHYVDEYLRTFTAVGSGQNIYTRARTVVNVGLAYQFQPAFSFTIDLENLFSEAQYWYRGLPDRTSQIFTQPLAITFGVSGRF